MSVVMRSSPLKMMETMPPGTARTSVKAADLTDMSMTVRIIESVDLLKPVMRWRSWTMSARPAGEEGWRVMEGWGK